MYTVIVHKTINGAMDWQLFKSSILAESYIDGITRDGSPWVSMIELFNPDGALIRCEHLNPRKLYVIVPRYRGAACTGKVEDGAEAMEADVLAYGELLGRDEHNVSFRARVFGYPQVSDWGMVPADRVIVSPYLPGMKLRIPPVKTSEYDEAAYECEVLAVGRYHIKVTRSDNGDIEELPLNESGFIQSGSSE